MFFCHSHMAAHTTSTAEKKRSRQMWQGEKRSRSDAIVRSEAGQFPSPLPPRQPNIIQYRCLGMHLSSIAWPEGSSALSIECPSTGACLSAYQSYLNGLLKSMHPGIHSSFQKEILGLRRPKFKTPRKAMPEQKGKPCKSHCALIAALRTW